MIVQENGKWVVKSHEGKSLGSYDSKAAAIKRLRAVEYFKENHSKEQYELKCVQPNLDTPDYIKEKHVAVFSDDGTEYSPEELKLIVDRTNARDTTCDLTAIIPKKHIDEEDPAGCPPVCGFVKNFQLVKGPDGNPTIVADLYIRADKEHLLKDYPRRSSEVWRSPKDMYIDPVVLLSETPSRDLGLTAYSKKGKHMNYDKQGSKPKQDTFNDSIFAGITKGTRKPSADWVAKTLRPAYASDISLEGGATREDYPKIGKDSPPPKVTPKPIGKAALKPGGLQATEYGSGERPAKPGSKRGDTLANSIGKAPRKALDENKVALGFPRPTNALTKPNNPELHDKADFDFGTAGHTDKAAWKRAGLTPKRISKPKLLKAKPKYPVAQGVKPPPARDDIYGFADEAEVGFKDKPAYGFKPEQYEKHDPFWAYIAGKEHAHAGEEKKNPHQLGTEHHTLYETGYGMGKHQAAQQQRDREARESGPNSLKRNYDKDKTKVTFDDEPGDGDPGAMFQTSMFEAGVGEHKGEQGYFWGKPEKPAKKPPKDAPGQQLLFSKEPGPFLGKHGQHSEPGPFLGKHGQHSEPGPYTEADAIDERNPHYRLPHEAHWAMQDRNAEQTPDIDQDAPTKPERHDKNDCERDTYEQGDNMEEQEIEAIVTRVLESMGLPELLAQLQGGQHEGAPAPEEELPEEELPEQHDKEGGVGFGRLGRPHGEGPEGKETRQTVGKPFSNEEMDDMYTRANARGPRIAQRDRKATRDAQQRETMSKENDLSERRTLARYSKAWAEKEAELQLRIADLERKGRLAERKNDLVQLETEGYQFPSFQAELDEVIDLAPAQYSKHLERIRACYQKAPIGKNPVTPISGGKQGFTFGGADSDSRKAADIVASGKAKSIPEAFQQLTGGI